MNIRLCRILGLCLRLSGVHCLLALSINIFLKMTTSNFSRLLSRTRRQGTSFLVVVECESCGGSCWAKRGGLRVICYVRTQPGVIWMLTLYAKNVPDNIPAHVLRKIRQEMEDV